MSQEGAEMNTVNANSSHRLWGWLGLVPLLVGASLALLQYAGWSAVVSGYYGLPSQAWRVKEAGTKAQLYGWVLVGLAAGATIVATILIPPLKSESVSPGLRGHFVFFWQSCWWWHRSRWLHMGYRQWGTTGNRRLSRVYGCKQQWGARNEEHAAKASAE